MLNIKNVLLKTFKEKYNKNKYHTSEFGKELELLKDKQKKLYNFNASINISLADAQKHHLRIIDAALPFVDHLISIAENAIISFYNLPENVQITENNREYMTAKIQIYLIKDIFIETDKAIETITYKCVIHKN